MAPLHRSQLPPVVIVDAADEETPRAVDEQLPAVRVVRQPHPDGVANAILLARPCLDDTVLVTLGDLFLDGEFPNILTTPAVAVWRAAPAAEIRKNFGVAVDRDGRVTSVVEKPDRIAGLECGVGVYVLSKAAIACFERAPIDSRGERGITAGIQTAIETGVAFRTLPFDGYYNNVNSHEDLAAVEAFLGAPVS